MSEFSVNFILKRNHLKRVVVALENTHMIVLSANILIKMFAIEVKARSFSYIISNNSC